MRRRKVLLAVTAVVVSLGSGTAFAYFTSSGSSSASASTGTMLTVTASAGTPNSALLPGATADVSLKITNPNSFTVTLTSVTGDGPITAGNGCSPTGVTFANQTGLSIPVPAGTSQVDLAGAAAMSSSSASACQGTTFSIPITMVVRK